MCIADEAFDFNSSGVSYLDMIIQKIVQSNNAYIASQTGNLFRGISVELAYVRHFPLYSEFGSDGVVKKENKITREFARDDLNDNLTGNKFTQNYYDADFCGLIYLTNDTDRADGGQALGNGANYGWAYFIIEQERMTDLYSLTFTHEIGHLFGCVHDVNNDRIFQANSAYHGFYSVNEEWHTIMSYAQRLNNVERKL